MENQIIIEVKNVYGNETIYPVNDAAKVLAEIAGTKTLTRRTLKLAQQLGYVVEIKQPSFAI
jgi:hypothetical protein